MGILGAKIEIALAIVDMNGFNNQAWGGGGLSGRFNSINTVSYVYLA